MIDWDSIPLPSPCPRPALRPSSRPSSRPRRSATVARDARQPQTLQDGEEINTGSRAPKSLTTDTVTIWQSDIYSTHTYIIHSISYIQNTVTCMYINMCVYKVAHNTIVSHTSYYIILHYVYIIYIYMHFSTYVTKAAGCTEQINMIWCDWFINRVSSRA